MQEFSLLRDRDSRDKRCVGGRASVWLSTSSYHTHLSPLLSTQQGLQGELFCQSYHSYIGNYVIWTKDCKMSILILNDISPLKIQLFFSPCCWRNISLHLDLSPSHCSMFFHYTVDVDVILQLYVLCFVSSDYFLFSSCLTHFTSLSYSSENMIEN